MKMVAAAKYARAERDLKPARVYGIGSLGKRNLLGDVCVLGTYRHSFVT